MTEKKVEKWCRQVGKNLIDLYDCQCIHFSRLLFPNKRLLKNNQKIKRVSEQEARFMFAHLLERKEECYYAVEVPTKKRYSDFSTNPTVYRGSQQGGRSGTIDMAVFNDEVPDNTMINIEFKKGPPRDSSIIKDLLKLLFEQSEMGVFYHLIEHTNSQTIIKFLDKFNYAAKEIQKKWSSFETSKILLFIVILEDDKNQSRCIKTLCDFSNPINIDDGDF